MDGGIQLTEPILCFTKYPTCRVWVWNAWDVVNGRSYTSVLMFMAVGLSWFLFLSLFLVLKEIGGWFFFGKFGEGNSYQIDLNLEWILSARFIWVVVEFKQSWIDETKIRRQDCRSNSWKNSRMQQNHIPENSEIAADDHSDNQSLQRPEGLTRHEDKDIHILVGGFNPVEKYSSKWIIFPNSGENKKYLKPPPRHHK